MKLFLFYIIIFSFIPKGSALAEICVYRDSIWENHKEYKKRNLLNSPSFENMDMDCFIYFLTQYYITSGSQNFASKLPALLRNYCQIHNFFDNKILHTLLQIADPVIYSSISIEIKRLWETYNGSLQNKISFFTERGLFNEIDSLYYSFNSLKLLDRYDLLKWARVKAVIGDYPGVAKIFCEISKGAKHFISMAQNQFIRILEETDSPQTQRKTLQLYKLCFTSRSDIDSLKFSMWLSRVYARFKLFDEEIEAITLLDNDSKSKGLRLLGVAQNRYNNNNFLKSIKPALLAWPFLSSDKNYRKNAVILYKSYNKIGKRDSAMIWLEKINLNNLGNKVDASVLYQNNGLLDKAQNTIEKLPQFISKDTLIIRQFLFENQMEKAKLFLSKLSWKYYRNKAVLDSYLWNIRIALFSGNQKKFNTLLDSINTTGFNSSWPYASEIISLRIARQRLEMNGEAFDFFATLSYKIFIHKSKEQVTNFKVNKFSQEIQELLVAMLVNDLVENKNFDIAQYLLNSVPELDKSPELNYFRAFINYKKGFIDKSKEILEKIIVSKPDDVFAHKARIFLTKIKQSENM